MTVLPRGRRQKLGLSSFADLTDVPVSSITKDAVTFDGALSDEDRAAVWAFLDATDDHDQAARAALRTLHAAVVASPTIENIAALVLANTNYMLGEA